MLHSNIGSTKLANMANQSSGGTTSSTRLSASSASPASLGLQRREQILALLRSRRAVRVSVLAHTLHVSEMTIRRDLDQLAEAGLLDKIHGGATLRPSSSNEEPGFEIKVTRNQVEKSCIAEAATALVTAGTAIGIGAGTTTWRLAQLLDSVENLVVVTNSVRIADVLERPQRSDRTVILTGGVRTPSDALVGPMAEQTLRTLHLDSVFLGTHGMSARAGFTSPNLAEAETNRVFVAAGQRVFMLADHTKWDVLGISSFAELSTPTAVLSDARLEAKARESFREHGTDVQLAPLKRTS
jgi:DeoR/GlpR family transcriptional regulator of sugar metabolism